MEKIIEGNTAIAKFLGWQFDIEPDEFGGELVASYKGRIQWRGERPDYLSDIMTSKSGYAFHSDWNKLMPVVEKIEKDFIVSIWWDCCEISAEKRRMTYPPMIQQRAETKIEATWQAVVQFITWYNQQSPSK